MILLERFYTPFGTWGKLHVEDFRCVTLENPWIGNKTYDSCIPEGIYDIGLRGSNVVKNNTGGRYEEGWEVQDVPGRTYIMIHPGNLVKHTEGCVLVGKEMLIHDNELFINHSQDTFNNLMSVLETRMSWEIYIRQWHPEYP